MDSPPLSVILPVHDAGRFLDEAVASVAAQTAGDFELIAVDDGSSDDSPARLAAWARRDSRIAVLRQDCLGVVAALNRGLAAARAPLVAIMHADDVARPDRFAKQRTYLAAHPEAALVGSAYEVVDAAGRRLKTVRPPTDPDVVGARLASGNCIAHPTVMARREALLAAGGYRPAYVAAEDYDLWLRLAERARLANLPDVTLSYRRHGSTASLRRFEQEVLCELAAQAAARLRRRGEADPTGECAAITRALLRRLGVGEE
ncbi:MAG: glycosyltransferase, partial [Rhodospirillaceae bacterium]|nr:glycosyltransferase [Rhodospirillaceae bacterium]